MFIADNQVSTVTTDRNVFIVDKWCEVETIDGWKSATNVVDGDMLVVEDDDTNRVIVTAHTVTADKVYYTVLKCGGDENEVTDS